MDSNWPIVDQKREKAHHPTPLSLHCSVSTPSVLPYSDQRSQVSMILNNILILIILFNYNNRDFSNFRIKVLQTTPDECCYVLYMYAVAEFRRRLGQSRLPLSAISSVSVPYFCSTSESSHFSVKPVCFSRRNR
jgi:hypothetical protein